MFISIIKQAYKNAVSISKNKLIRCKTIINVKIIKMHFILTQLIYCDQLSIFMPESMNTSLSDKTQVFP